MRAKGGRKKEDYFYSSAQGTIEYLVIISIVVVLSLVVVGIIVAQIDSSSNVTVASSEINSKIGVEGLSVSSSVAGVDKNGLLVIKNINPGNLTITKIVIDGVDHNFYEQLVSGSEKNFNLHNLYSCDDESKEYLLKIEYTTQDGLNKSSDFKKIQISCVQDVSPLGAFVEESSIADDEDVTPPSALLSLPAESSSTSDSSITYSFSVDSSDVNYCFLVLNQTAYSDKNISGEMSAGETYSITYVEIPVGDYIWDINCIDTSGNMGSSNEQRSLLVMPSGLIAHFKMNDNTSSTLVTDSIGTYNAVSTVNTNTIAAGGKLDSALAFNGSSTKVTASTSPHFYFSGDFTVTLWVYWNGSTTYYQNFIGSTTGFSSNSAFFRVWGTAAPTSTLRNRVGVGNPSHDSTSSVYSPNTIPTATWTHIAASRINGVIKLYINGVLVRTGATDNSVYDFSQGGTTIGDSPWDGSNGWFSGRLDDIRIYNVGLDETEINMIYNSGNGTEAG